MSKVTRILRHCFDLLLFLLLVCIEYALRRWFQPHQRGFFCGDESLQYPIPNHGVSLATLLAIALGIPAAIIIITEHCRQLSSRVVAGGLDKRHIPLHNDGTVRRPYRFLYRLGCCYAQLGYFISGLLMTLITTEIPKRALGRLRPYFFNLCQPQFANGTDCSFARNAGHYFETYVCAAAPGDYPLHMREINLSFPSGHSSLSTFGLLYAALYLQVALSTRISKLFKHLVQFGLMLLALYVSLTRVIHFWHHWTDVLAGMLLGGVMAILVARYMARMFERGSPSPRLALTSSTAALASTHSSSPVLPSYTFGNLSYLQHHQNMANAAAAAAATHPAYAQTYHNYGYVP